MSVQHVKSFYERLSQDEVFRDQIKNVHSKEDCSRIVKAAGCNFTQQEFEDYTAQLLEKEIVSSNSLVEIGERELEAVHGGFLYRRDMGHIYGLPPLDPPFMEHFENE
jgi:predicted ribosomally synthesized peptide with nif11-like leader